MVNACVLLSEELEVLLTLDEHTVSFTPLLTESSCLINMSDAFSEMFPTNTVVVGPLFSSGSFAVAVGASFLGTATLLTTDIEAGTRTLTSQYKLHINLL